MAVDTEGVDVPHLGDLRADARAARVAATLTGVLPPKTVRAAPALAGREPAWRSNGPEAARRRAWLAAVVAGRQVLPGVTCGPGLLAYYDVLPDRERAARSGPGVLWLTGRRCVAAASKSRPHPRRGLAHPPDRTDADSWVDERMISQALAHLGSRR